MKINFWLYLKRGFVLNLISFLAMLPFALILMGAGLMGNLSTILIAYIILATINLVVAGWIATWVVQKIK